MVGNSEELASRLLGSGRTADGYDIALGPARTEQSEMKLFFFNLGGYDPDNFGNFIGMS